MEKSSRPAQIIEVYTELLVEAGVRQASLDAVAREVGLSKAGLLHYFPSRKALDAGLLDNLMVLVDKDVVAMREAPEGAAHYYLTSSFEASSDLERGIAAATRLAQAGSEQAGQALRRARDQWYSVLSEDLGDQLLARFVLLAGDGVSYHTDIDGGDGTRLITREDVDRFAGLVDRLR